jgi:membrane-associated phospholipid phosphatase
MFQFFSLANARLILLLNHFVASSPALYQFALHTTDKLSDVFTLATFALMWFWPQPREREYLKLYPDPHTSPLQNLKEWPARVRAHWIMTISREQSRAQFLVLGMAGVLGYVTARLIAFEVNAPRPFMSWLPIKAGIPGAFEGLRTYGSFPSDHAVLLAAVPTALFFWDRRLAYVWIPISIFLAITRVAVGFHTPLDMFAGALIGFVITYTLLWVFRRRRAFRRSFITLTRGYELRAAPYCYILYFITFLGAVEFAMHFQHVLDALFALRSDLMVRLTRGG